MNKHISSDGVRVEIERYRPDFVVTMDYLPVSGAISTATVPAALKALEIAKEVDPGIVTLIAGPHPTFFYKKILNDPGFATDFVLRGEAEESLLEQRMRTASGRTPSFINN